MQGAGGVSGLVKVTYYGATTTNAFVAYDGNGNLMALVDASNGNVCARYEYGPFAEPIRVSGSMGKLNPVRFSSKYTDDESGFLYYGYRYYNPSTGRWLSRDAIGERGGFNLCTFVANDSLGYVDHSGLAVYPLGRTDPKGNPWPQPAPIPFPPGGPVNLTPNLPPNSPNLPTTPASTPMQGAAGAIPIAAEYFAAGLEQWLLNYYIDEGLKYCRAQAKQKGGCCFGCCVINLYLVTGKYDSYRNLFSGSPQFFSKPCFSVQADMAVIDSQPGLEPYFGRWEYERWWGYRLVNPNAPDANRMRPIDDRSHIRRYLDMLSCNAK